MSKPPKLATSYSTVSGKDLLEQVVSDYEIKEPQECLFWQRGTNDTYEVRCKEARYSLRVYRHDIYPREAIEFEAAALEFLHLQGIAVAYPIARKSTPQSGEFVTEILAPEGSRFVLLSAFADGKEPDYDEPGNCHLVGESVARIHQASDNFNTPHKRTRLDLQGLLEDSMVVLRQYMAHRPDDLAFIEKLANDSRETVRAVPEDSADIGFCHGDLHGYNLHIHEDKVTHFDFEECGFGYRVFDLATFKWGTCQGEKRAKRWPEFLAGYESIRPISGPDLALIDTFVIIRHLWLVAFHLRNVEDFGYDLTSEGYFDHQCKALKRMAGMEEEKS